MYSEETHSFYFIDLFFLLFEKNKKKINEFHKNADMKNLIRNKPFKIFKAFYANRILIEPKKKSQF